MTNHLDYNNLLERVAALQIEAAAFISVTTEAKPFFIHTQEAFPYFVNRISNDDVTFDSEDFDRDTETVIMRLVIGHITEGYEGQPESVLYNLLPAIKLYFNQHELLQSAAYPTAMVGLLEARVGSHTGFRIFQNTGISANQVGSEITLTCQLDETISQAYT
jgi:hypothetical protein